jgi:serine protease
VTVAVLDTGVHPAAEDLANTSFASGWDFTDGDERPMDLNGHGTHVTGIIAQSTNNGIGTAGIAHSVTIMPVKVLDDSGVGLTSRIMEGLYFAATSGADVINLSFGYPAALGDPGQPLHEAVSYAASKGVTLVAAAGNEGFKSSVSYPAAYPECIAVGATRFDNRVTSYSNKGVALELVAPGGDLTVDQNRDGFPDGILQESLSDRTFGYYYAQGTSMAAPHVSATAALVISLGVNNPCRVREILRDTARDLGKPGLDKRSGYGLIDARRAAEEACKLASRCNG